MIKGTNVNNKTQNVGTSENKINPKIFPHPTSPPKVGQTNFPLIIEGIIVNANPKRKEITTAANPLIHIDFLMILFFTHHFLKFIYNTSNNFFCFYV